MGSAVHMHFRGVTKVVSDRKQSFLWGVGFQARDFDQPKNRK